MSYLAAIIILGVLVFVHELGHFLVAKMCKVGVIEFALGFGPKIFSFVKGETAYSVRAIPLGGFVQMVGESNTEDEDILAERKKFPESSWFVRKSLFSRSAIVFAGPLFNLLFAVVVSFFSFAAFGAYDFLDTPVIGNVMPDSPAEKAGLKQKDKVLSVNGVEVHSWASMADIIAGGKGAPVNLSIKREDSAEPLTINITPEKEKAEELVIRGGSAGEERFRVGIVASNERKPVTLSQAAIGSTMHVWGISVMTVRGISGLIRGLISTDHISGPIFIVGEAAKTATKGLEKVLDFLVFMSVSLALLNLLPIPVLDGGHLLMFLIEAIIRRPVPLKAQGVVTQIGFAFLMFLTLFAISNDIRKLF